MLVFGLFIQRVANFDTHGVPYALFSYVALIPWAFFSTSVSLGGQSLVTNNSLLNKVYCPREVFPFSSILVAVADMSLASVVLLLLFPITGYAPRLESFWVPVLLVVQVGFTVGIVLIISSVLVYLRDLRQALPILLQLGVFASPVAYGMDVIPPGMRAVYSALNPLAPVMDGYRRTILYGQQPNWELLSFGALSTTIVLLVGYWLFKRLETNFADVA
jgi:ABC-2 type transport system permease protein/lipopolysaccharide transport system permease protein